MKKLCFVVSSSATALAFLKGPMQQLSRYYEIHLIANTTDTERLYEELPIKQFHFIPIERGLNPLHDFFTLFQITRFLRSNSFDALHSVSPKAGLMAMVGGFIARTPIRTHTFTGQVWANKKGVLHFILKNIDRLIAHCATHVLVDGVSQLNFLWKQNVVNKEAKVLGKGSICGVSLTRFTPTIEIRKKRRFDLGINKDEWVFMFLGRLNKDKGVIDLINAFIQLNQAENSCSLYLVGHDEEEIESRYSTLSNKIHFIPFDQKPETLLQACDTFCLPSYREGFGLSVIEASALEKPIICSDAYGLADTIIDHQTGLRHRMGDVHDLQQQLSYAIHHPEKMNAMGRAGREYVKERFSEEYLLTEWEKFYSENLGYKR